MACLNEQTAGELIAGKLAKERATKAKEHISDCESCRDLLDKLASGPTLAAGSAESAIESGATKNLRGDKALPAKNAALPESTLTETAGPGKGPASEERKTIGRYRLLEKLGEGGMGEVYLAEDPELTRRVAIKLMHSGTRDATKALLREARAMAKLRHPNVATVYEVGSAGQDVFVAMEFIEGTTLRDWFEEEHDLEETIAMFAQAGRGLAAAHERDLVHRDFKPDNVMVGADGRAQVLDFGLAISATPDILMVTGSPIEDTPIIDKTGIGALVGTPAYMAPEQYHRLATDARTDQFSFCVALFEALHGTRPFQGKNLSELSEAVKKGLITKPSGKRVVPEAIQNAIERGLSVFPEERFASMDDLLKALQPRQKKSLLVPALAAVAVVAIAVAGFSMTIGSDSPSTAPAAVAEKGEYDEIFATSNLPETLKDPDPDDPLGVTIHQLSNGLTVYISPDPRHQDIGAELIIRAGSRDEGEVLGLARIVTLMTGGTDRLGTIDYDKEKEHLDNLHKLYARLQSTDPGPKRNELIRKIDEENAASSIYSIPDEFATTAELLGIRDLRAVAGQDASHFQARVPAAVFEQWAQLEGERWRHPVFRDFHGVMARILRILVLQIQVGEPLGPIRKGLFRGHPYSRSPSESFEDALSEPLLAAEDFLKTWYVPNNAALVLTGNITPNRALRTLEEAFAEWKPALLPERTAAPSPLTDDVALDLSRDRPDHVTIGWLAPGLGSQDVQALKILENLTNSELRFHEVEAELQSFADASMWTLTASAQPEQSLDQVFAIADKIASELAAGRLDSTSMEAAIGKYRLAQIESIQEHRGRTSIIADAYISQRDWKSDASQWRSRLETLQKDHVTKVARKYLDAPRVVLRSKEAPQDPPEFQLHPITPTQKAAGRSEFSTKLLEQEGLELTPRFYYRDADFEYRETPAGPLITAPNPDSDQYLLSYRWDVDLHANPLVCAALGVLQDAGDDERSAMERKRDWKSRGLVVDLACADDRIFVRINGSGKKLSASRDEVMVWLRGAGLTEELWSSALQDPSRITKNPDLKLMVNRLVSTGQSLGRGFSSVQDSTVEMARAALGTLLSTRRSTLYYGPLSADSVLEAPKSPLAKGYRRPPLRFKKAERPKISLYDTEFPMSVASLDAQVPLGQLDAARFGPFEVLAAYLEDVLNEVLSAGTAGPGTVGTVTFVPGYRGDDSSLLISLAVESHRLPAAVRAVLSILDPKEHPESFDEARLRTERAYRSYRIPARDLPAEVEGWVRRGLGTDRDPRQEKFRTIRALKREDLAALLGTLRSAPVFLSSVGNLAETNKEELASIVEVHALTHREVLGLPPAAPRPTP